MATVREGTKPQDIVGRTFAFALAIVRLCHTLDSRPGVRRTLGSQLLRSGTSIGANMEEAQAGQSKADFLHKCGIALKEARETLYWLRLLHASGEVSEGTCEPLIAEAGQLAKIVGAIIVSGRTQPRK